MLPRLILSLDGMLCLIYLQTMIKVTTEMTNQAVQVLKISNSREKDINNKEECRGEEGQKAQLPEDSFNHVEFVLQFFGKLIQI